MNWNKETCLRDDWYTAKTQMLAFFFLFYSKRPMSCLYFFLANVSHQPQRTLLASFPALSVKIRLFTRPYAPREMNRWSLKAVCNVGGLLRWSRWKGETKIIFVPPTHSKSALSSASVGIEELLCVWIPCVLHLISNPPTVLKINWFMAMSDSLHCQIITHTQSKSRNNYCIFSSFSHLFS